VNGNQSKEQMRFVFFMLAGYVAVVASCGLLWYFWEAWESGSWADYPNLAFGADWFEVPPTPVTFVPLAISAVAIGIFAFALPETWRRRRVGHLLLVGFGLLLACLPMLVTIVLPAISDVLHRPQSGCVG